MNRALLVFAISLIAGILLPCNAVVMSVIFTVLACAYLVCLIKLKRHFILTIIVGIISGILLSAFAPEYSDGEIAKYLGNSVPCTMIVSGSLNTTDKYTKFQADIVTVDGKNTDEKAIVYVYGDNKIKVNSKVVFDKIKFKLPADEMNYGGFDYRKHLAGKGVFFTATANAENIKGISDSDKTIMSVALDINDKISTKIDKTFNEKTAGIFKAILLGNKSDVDEGTLDDFRNSGLSHVMAVSGLHLTIIVMLLGIFTRYIGRWGRFIISAIAITAFVFITGMPVSVIRAAIMLLVLQLSDALYFENDSLTNLALAVLVVVIPNPNAIYDTSFILSFSATFGILCLTDKIAKLVPESVPDTIRDCVCITLAAQVGTLPFSAMYFGQLSLLAIVSNLLIVALMPLIYIVGIPAIVIAWKPLVRIAEAALSLLGGWASFCSKLPGQMQYIPINPIVIFGLCCFSLVAVTVSAFKNKRIVSWLLAGSMLISVFGGLWQIKPVKGAEITFINVGQADSALVRTEESVFLVDTATEYMGSSEISGYLLRCGITELDGIFISHFDSDHCGGLISVLECIDTQAIYVPDTRTVDVAEYNIRKYAEASDIPVITLRKGDRVEFPDINIEVLMPQSNGENISVNQSSLVFRAENKNVSVLFSGDIIDDSTIENCDTDILKVSHHGSKNGTTEEFLKNNTPQIAVMSLAENNPYGFPHKELLERLDKYTKLIYRTDLSKTVTVKCRDRKYEVKTMR